MPKPAKSGLEGHPLEAYVSGIIFEWDHEKSEKNRRERGFPFSYAIGIFGDRTIAIPSDRDSEERTKFIGKIDGRFYAVIVTERGADLYRVISARRARTNEEALW